MKYFNKIIRVFIYDDAKLLGRWTIDYSHKKINHTIDLSNRDHCGPCGEYTLDKKDKEIVKIQKPTDTYRIQ